jgi:molybdopterin/thiamine biosynthesis adenylyltransferase
MTLTDAQIERYSRQIIVPHVGGRGQERLLAANVLLIGDARDIEAPLAYLDGAGVGKISLRTDDSQSSADLAVVFVGSEATRRVAQEIANRRDARAMVIARLDAPGKIAVIPDAQSAIDASMFAELGERTEAADFIAMLATAEAFKLLAGYAENPPRAIIEFDGYASRGRVNP